MLIPHFGRSQILGVVLFLLVCSVSPTAFACPECGGHEGHDHSHDHSDSHFHGVTASAEAAPGLASAAFVTPNEVDLDAIFSQASFGSSPIDIVFQPTVEIVEPDLVDITTVNEQNRLLKMDVVDSPGVNLFYVDTVDYCGGFNKGIVGCAFQPGNNTVVESGFASGSRGAELIAHEIVHNLGLSHESTANLMSPTINGNTMLTQIQAAMILNSPLVQSEGSYHFIEVTPVLVVAAATATIPEPVGFATVALALAPAAVARRRRSARWA